LYVPLVHHQNHHYTFPQNPSPSRMDIAVVTPRQLASSMGSPRASTKSILDSSVQEEPICFGSFTFTPHSPAQRSAFSSFHEGIDLALGDLRFRVNSVGTLRLPDPIWSIMTESTTSSNALASPAASSVGSSSEPTSASTSIYCVGCDA
jgi:hypothetical protein